MMNPFLPAGDIPFPCPHADGCAFPCATGKLIAAEDDPDENEDGELVCRGYCYQLRPPEPFTLSYADVQEARMKAQEEETESRKSEVGSRKSDARKTKQTKKRNRAKLGELTQDDVAKDFGVARKTVNKWERNQTEDGPGNRSNPWGYYKSLRLRPDLRDAYELLFKQAQMYQRIRQEEVGKGKRFKITFESFNEFLKKHNQQS